MILLTGWMGILVGQFGWFANVAFVAALIIVAMPMRSVMGQERNKIWGWIALVLLIAFGADAALWHEMYGDNGSTRILSFGVGYYLWFAAMFGATGALIFCLLFSRRVAPHVETATPGL
jgi:hypothetical protein